jgi:hypothetical protein
MKKPKTTGWNVYLRGKWIDRVFYYNPTGDLTAAEVMKDLVDHDNYDPAIVVRARCPQGQPNPNDGKDLPKE